MVAPPDIYFLRQPFDQELHLMGKNLPVSSGGVNAHKST